jgi:predicted amidohydrolase
VYGPDGALAGISRKANLIDMEYRELDLSAAPLDELPVYEMAGTRAGVAICRDVWEPPVTQWLQEQGARGILSPQANPFPWASEKAVNREGLFARCQEQGLFGVQAMAVGRLADVGFEGQSAVFAPRAMTPDGSGVIAEATSCTAEELVVADVPAG